MSLQKKFENIGGQFFTPEKIFRQKARNIKAYIFDWDGVFNNGEKASELGSSFSEPDSMGTNMLRFSFWLKNHFPPYVYIITGEKNITAVNFANREHFHGVFLSYKNKVTAIEEIKKKHEIEAEEIAFFFDDIIDLGVAEICGITICIKREANPLFNDFVINGEMCDYMTGHTGGNHAIREATELLIGMNGNYKETISKRILFEGDYSDYLKDRNSIELQVSKGM